MFMSQILISCVLLVAAQASYAPSSNYGAVLGGYAAHQLPRATLSIGSYGVPYGSGYGNAYGNVAANANNAAAALNAEAIGLARSVFNLADAGNPIPTSLNIPLYSTTAYTSPSVVAVPGPSPNKAAGQTAAAAASNVDKNHAVLSKLNYGNGYGNRAY